MLLLSLMLTGCGKGFKAASINDGSFSGSSVLNQLSFSSPSASFETQAGLSITGTCVTGKPVEISGDVTSPANVACSNSVFNATLTLSAGDGLKSVAISQTLDNGLKLNSSRSFRRDATPPALTIVVPTSGQVVSSQIGVSGSCETGLQVEVTGSGLLAPAAQTCSSGSFNLSVAFSSGAGAKAFEVKQTDRANNTTTLSRSVTRDASVGPAIAILAPAANSFVQNTVSLSGSCQAGLTVTFSGAGWSSPANTTCASGTFSAAITLSSGDGVKNIIASQTNSSGVSGSDSRSFVRDQTPPALTIASPAAGTSATTGLTVTGACESGLAVQASGSGLSSAMSGTCSAGAYSLAISFSSGDGAKAVTISQTDAAGNAATLSRSFNRISAQIDGALLYAQNCAACHGAIVSSSKLGRTATQISGAIMSIPLMANLSFLTSAQVDAIAKALAPPTTPTAQLYQCTSPVRRGMSDGKMRRLIKGELINTLADLFGGTVVDDSQIQVQLGLFGTDYIDGSVHDVALNPPATQFKALLEIASRAADLISENSTRRERVFGTCASSSTITNTCVQNFIAGFGLRAYRRPVTTAEASALLAHYTSAGGGVDGLKVVLMRLLLSPSLAFQLEFGGSTVNGDRVRLTDYEIASRLSYRLTGTLPDSELLTAAGQGQLQSVANVRTQAQRLMSLPRGREKVDDFFRYYLQIDKYPEPFAAAGTLNGISTSGLQSELVNETKDFVNHIVWTKRGRFKDLLTSREVFPRSTRMASILETTVPVGSAPSLTNEAHMGILLRPGFLATSTPATLPFHRAIQLRKRILCQVYGPPDPSLVAERQQAAGDLSTLSNRERATKLTDAPQCMSCHSSINPTGFVLENYDQLGMRRSVETVFNASGQVTTTHPIDTRVTDPQIEDANGPVGSFDNAVQMVQAIASGKAARACFARQVFEFQRVRSHSNDDYCALSEAEASALDSGNVQDVFINGTVNDDIFWKARGL